MTIMDVVKEKGLIFDGAMGTMLMRAGLEGGKASEAWILERPEVIKKIHQSYFDAGAEVITTCTFGGNSMKLKKAGLEDHARKINSTAVEIARKVVGKECYVAGNIGPTGLLLEPSGPLSLEAAKESFANQARVLSESGVDLFMLATFFDLNESLAAVDGVRSVSDLPVFASMTFQEMDSGFATIMGNRIEPSMKALMEAGAAVVGANCSLGSDGMLAVAEVVRGAVETPVLIQPNAGIPRIEEGRTFYPENAETYSENLLRIKELGVEVIGGCCGSTPECIERIVKKVRQQ
jgi:5-methyltetrahydrofolate--homocysteine methyltransferase